MKKTFLLSVLLVFAVFINAQSIKTDKFELYLNDYLESEVSISKGMYMTSNMQYFYDGKIEVNYIDTNITKMYQFYFSTWDKTYKEFIVKDMKYNEVSSKFSFTDNKLISYEVNGELVTKELQNVENVDYAILSSMLVWLENFEQEK